MIRVVFHDCIIYPSGIIQSLIIFAMTKHRTSHAWTTAAASECCMVFPPLQGHLMTLRKALGVSALLGGSLTTARDPSPMSSAGGFGSKEPAADSSLDVSPGHILTKVLIPWG